MFVPLVLYYLCPCASHENYFEKSLIQFFLSYPLINCLYSRMFPVVSLGTAFILRREFMDGSGAQLVSCRTVCYNLEGRFLVVKAVLVLSR